MPLLRTEPTPECGGLAHAKIRQWNIHVAFSDVESLDLSVSREVPRNVAETLAVPHQPEFGWVADHRCPIPRPTADQSCDEHKDPPSNRVGDVIRDDVDVSRPVVVLFTGPPATGKSSLAEHAAHTLSAPVLAWDWAMGALTTFDGVQAAFRQMTRDEYRSVGWSILWNLTIAQVRREASAVLDGVARDREIAATRALAADAGATVLVISTSCSDENVHRARVGGRMRGIPGWHELEWDHVAEVTSQWIEPADADLRLDAVDPFEANVERLTNILAARAS